MKHITPAVVFWLFLPCLLTAAPLAASAAVLTAANCTQSEVQAKVTAASAGDTVVLPSCTATWTAGVSVTKSITIQGAGPDSTVITINNTTAFDIDVTGGTWKLTGIGFLGSVPTWGAAININGLNSTFRAGNLKFTGLTVGSGSVRAFALGQRNWRDGRKGKALRGVFDHIVADIAVPTLFIEAYGQDDSWTQPDMFGTDDALYMEDSSLTYSGPNSAYDYIIPIDGESGPRIVLRNNIFTNTLLTWHDTGSVGEARGTRSYEIYGNTIRCTSAKGCVNAVDLRGGTGMVHNNKIYPAGFWASTFSEIFRVTYPDPTNPNTYYPGQPWSGKCNGTNYRICSNFRSHCSGGNHRECYGSGDSCTTNGGAGSCVDACSSDSECPSGYSCIPSLDGTSASGWPCRDQTGTGQDDPVTHAQPLDPTYWFNNINPGTNAFVSFAPSGGNASYIQANRDYYNSVTNFNGTVGVGVGSLAQRPATCTPGSGNNSFPGNSSGVGYWATDENKLYTCTAPNTWTLRYAPFPYPHPLVSGSAAPAAPSSVQVAP